jgi:hypothetical protein
MPKSFSARMFVALIVISGLLVLGNALLSARSVPTGRFVSFLLVACLAARLKIKLPGLTGTMSVNLPFILLAAAEMNATEALTVGLISTIVQCLPRGKQKINLVQAAFSCGTIMLAVAVTRLIYVAPAVAAAVPSEHVRLAVAAIGYALVNTIPIAIVIGLTEAVSAWKTWIEMLQLSFPYLVASAGVAGLALTVTPEIAWQVPLAVLPVMAGIFQSYRRYFVATAAAAESSMEVQASSMAAGAHV